MKWINLEEEKNNFPTPKTKVVVQTQTKHTEGNVLKVSFDFDKHGKPVWGCNNQTVTHFLKEN